MQFDTAAYNQVINSVQDGIYLVDNSRTIVYWNKGAERITGYQAEEVLGKSCADNILTHVDGDGNSLCHGLCPLLESMNSGTALKAEVFLHHKKGHRIPVSVSTNVLNDSTGKTIGGIEVFSDISNQQANDQRLEELEKLALLDSLTQLANRYFITNELESRFEEKRRLDVAFGVLFMDVDHFKQFNDTYGHDVGDKVLQLIARTFVSNSRPFDIYGRWGGEEFIGILRGVSEQEMISIADRLRMLVESSYLTHGDDVLRVTISIGATLVREKDTIDTIIKRADALLYESKRGGRNRVTTG